MIKTNDDHIDLYDEQGRLIGEIVKPQEEPVTGPGAEKVYLVRRHPRLDRTPVAA